jgi:hypothetical protein
VELAITKELCLAQKTSSATLIIHAALVRRGIQGAAGAGKPKVCKLQ